jgi:E3 ubiquitin-protein ligase RNF14
MGSFLLLFCAQSSVCEILSEILNLLYLIQARQKSGQIQGDQQKILDELRSLKEIMKDAKQCPKCKMAISKTEGCNKMVCWNCKEYFCYQCNSAITGYEHFR